MSDADASLVQDIRQFLRSDSSKLLKPISSCFQGDSYYFPEGILLGVSIQLWGISGTLYTFMRTSYRKSNLNTGEIATFDPRGLIVRKDRVETRAYVPGKYTPREDYIPMDRRGSRGFHQSLVDTSIPMRLRH